MTQQTYPSGRVIGYEYSDKGELVSITIDGTPFIKNIKTNDNGLLSYEYADGSKHTREYDTNGRVTKLTYPNYTEEINYNVVSNITNIKSDFISRAFGYDNLDRLTSYEQNATDFQHFVYDGNGNRLNQDQENNETKQFTYALNSNILNSIVESNSTDSKNITYEYDTTGNIIKDDKHSYTYDSRNRLIAIDNNVTYQYNYDNKRVSKTVNGVKTYFIYDGHKLIGEYRLNLSDNSRQEFVYLNSTPIAVMSSNKIYRVYADHLDTSRRVATNDSDAQIVWKWESKPFGESKATGDITFNLRFPGQYFDAETGHHYNINRDYNPVTGRYIQSDPIGFDGGVNGYLYASGSPIIGVDLLGLWGSWTYEWADLGLSECKTGTYDLYGDKVVIEKCTSNNIALPQTPAWHSLYADGIVDANLKETPTTWWMTTSWKLYYRGVWAKKVWPRGKWDYKVVWKNSVYQHLGNFNYGATGNKVGFWLWELMAVGGGLATYKGQDNPGPFNDQHVDQFWVEQGYKYYDYK